MSTSKSYKDQFKLIKQDVRKTYDSITRDLAKNARNDLIKSVYSVIEDFYETYNPKKYERTKNLYNMVSTRPVYRKDNGHIASIATSSLFMYENYNASPEVVYDLMWNKGHRGLPFQNLIPTWKPQVTTNETIISSSSPHNAMEIFVNSWGENFGKKQIDKIDKKYKNNTYIKF